jgi:hypothetical protein
LDADRIEETVARLVAATDTNEADAAAIDAARRQLADCDARLAKYRTALERGTDPTVIAAWIAEVQGQRLAAERQLALATPSAPLSAADVAQIIEELGDIRPVLAGAEPRLKAEVYGDLGITVTYRPAQDTVAVTALPMLSKVRVGGGT